MKTALENYLDSIGVTVDSARTYGEIPNWAEGMDKYECILKRNGERMFAIPFYQGKAHTKPPKREDVIHSLLADRGTLQYANDFEGWADGLGYNSDSISDKKLFDTISEQSERVELHFKEAELSVLSELMEDY